MARPTPPWDLPAPCFFTPEPPGLAGRRPSCCGEPSAPGRTRRSPSQQERLEATPSGAELVIWE